MPEATETLFRVKVATSGDSSGQLVKLPDASRAANTKSSDWWIRRAASLFCNDRTAYQMHVHGVRGRHRPTERASALQAVEESPLRKVFAPKPGLFSGKSFQL
jgi:hypothetical protein